MLCQAPVPPAGACQKLWLFLPCANGPLLHSPKQKATGITGGVGHKAVDLRIAALYLWSALKSHPLCDHSQFTLNISHWYFDIGIQSSWARDFPGPGREHLNLINGGKGCVLYSLHLILSKKRWRPISNQVFEMNSSWAMMLRGASHMITIPSHHCSHPSYRSTML